MEKNNLRLVLALMTVIFLAAGHTVLPFVLFFALAPLFRIYEDFKQTEESFGRYALYILLPLILGYSCIAVISDNTPGLWLSLTYGVLMAFSFYIFWLTDKYARNRLGFFTVALYWLAMEYVALKLFPGFAYMLAGRPFEEYPDLISWNIHTGLMGVSAWVLTGNILMYYALFKGEGLLSGRFRPLTLFYALLGTLIPAFIAWQLFDTTTIITAREVFLAYANPEELPANFNSYAITGEVFGRTAAWVSVLLILYSLVRRKVNKP